MSKEIRNLDVFERLIDHKKYFLIIAPKNEPIKTS